MNGKTNTVLTALKTLGLGSFLGWNVLLFFIIYIMFTQNVFMETFFILWMLVLPLGCIALVIFDIIWWFVVVPGVSRRLTWARFKSGELQGVATDTGVFDVVQSKLELPAGGILNKFGWWLKPRPTYKKKGTPTETTIQAEHLILKKYLMADVGKPISFGHLGKMSLVNPATLAALSPKPDFDMNPHKQISAIEQFAATLPKHLSKELRNLVSDLKEHLQLEPITWFSMDAIREILPQNFTQTQLDDIAYNRELYGRRSAGKEMTKMAILIILAVLGFVTIIGAIYILTGGLGG